MAMYEAITEFEELFSRMLPETFRIVRESNLVAHPAVNRIILSGSRGLARKSEEGSDLDLTLIVDVRKLPPGALQEMMLREILDTTLNRWQGNIELDPSIAFETQNCGFKCFEESIFREDICEKRKPGCCGVFKAGGYVNAIGIRIENLYPCIAIWRRG